VGVSVTLELPFRSNHNRPKAKFSLLFRMEQVITTVSPGMDTGGAMAMLRIELGVEDKEEVMFASAGIGYTIITWN